MDTQKTVVVTGATSGLGEAAALAFAAAGWRVLVVGRDATRGADVVARAQAAGGRAELLTADLFTVAGVRALGEEVRLRAPRLDLLINNAGGMFSGRTLSSDGLERTYALNVMAPFVLSQTLLPSLSAANGRIVNLVTGIPNGATATLAQLAGAENSGGLGAYTRCKLALLALTFEQQRRYASRGVTAVSLHPGIIPGTRFGQDLPAALRAVMGFMAKLFRFGSKPAEAAQRYLKVGAGEVEGGAFYKEGTRATAPKKAYDAAFALELWAHLEGLERTASATPPVRAGGSSDAARAVHN